MKKFLLSILLSLATLISHAQASNQPLLPEQAFTLSAHVNQPDQLILQWNIAPGYYLYQNQLHLSSNQIKITHFTLPPGITQHDAIHGTSQVYTGTLKIVVPLTPTPQASLALTIEYQGCSSKGFCYSPIKKNLQFNITHPSRLLITSTTPATSEPAYAEMIFTKHNLLIIVLSFLGLGLLLAFTPCVLPMVPILSGIIIGQRKKNPTTKTFGLSLAYVLGMAITYAIAGLIVALIGSRIQTELQKPWIIILFSGIFVLLALSLFGLYEFQLPSRWQKRLTELSNRQKGGAYLSVFIMGSISSLIVSPCISPALVGVLAYIAHTGDLRLGALALLSLGIGMGLPLLLVGASVAKFLPKTGAWMQTIEHLVGVMMLAFAIWLLARIIPGPLALSLWSILLITSAIMMGDFTKIISHWQHLRHGLATFFLVYGIILLIGALLGNADPLHPWEKWRFTSNTALYDTQATFITLKDMTQLDQKLAQAKQEKKWVLLDFSASWCESCVRMERYVFTKLAVKQALANFILLRGDITADNHFDQALMQRFHVIAPPTLLFFAPNGKELIAERWIGEATAAELLAHTQKLKETTRVD